MKEQEKHICIGCGQEAKFQMKNGKWYCVQNAHKCPGVAAKVKQKAIEKWKQIKQKIQTQDLKQQHVCFYCGGKAVFQIPNKRWCCHEYTSQCPAIRQKNSKTRKYQLQNGIINKNLKHLACKGHPAWNKGLTKQTNASMKQISQTLKKQYKSGIIQKIKYNHNKEIKQLLSKLRSQQIAKDVHGGFNSVKWYYLNNLKGQQCCVRGNWQLWTAQYLNANNINWQRNKILKYIKDDQVIRRYVPDFYLTDLNLYLQVKGYYSQQDKQKITYVLAQNNIKLLWVDKRIIQDIKNNSIDFNSIPFYNQQLFK